MKPLQSVPPLCQQFILNQIPGIVRKTIRPQQTKFGKPRFDFLRNAIRFVLAKAHKPLPFVASHIPVHDHECYPLPRTTTSVNKYHNFCRNAGGSTTGLIKHRSSQSLLVNLYHTGNDSDAGCAVALQPAQRSVGGLAH